MARSYYTVTYTEKGRTRRTEVMADNATYAVHVARKAFPNGRNFKAQKRPIV